jgi:hypothetical protein
MTDSGLHEKLLGIMQKGRRAAPAAAASSDSEAIVGRIRQLTWPEKALEVKRQRAQNEIVEEASGEK